MKKQEKKTEKIQLFEDQPIRTAWDEEKEEWYFSVVDVVGALTSSADPQTYWRVTKKRLKDEGNESVTNCNALKMKAADGKRRLTDEWKSHGIDKSSEFAMLTDELTKAWSGMTTRQYKNHKGLKKESLRDNMSTTELVLNMLAETATKEIAQSEDPEGFEENKKVAGRGGKIAGDARKSIEAETGKSVITSQNAAQLNHVVAQMIEASVKAVEEDDDK